MRLFRKILFWCHLIIGVTAGLVILTMSITGVLLTYERQITAWADTRGYQVTPPASSAARLPVETLIEKAREAQPGAAITTITQRANPSEPVAIGLAGPAGAGPGGGRSIFVNPYTGAVLGEGAKGSRDFFRVVTDLHRWLGASGENRAAARAITGACNLGFLFIVVSGFYLWWPKKWTRAQIRNVAWFKRGLPGKARDFNWHNVIGLWSCVPLFIVVISGVVISYPWASNLVYRIVGETPPATRGPGGPGGPPQGAAGQTRDRAERGGSERGNAERGGPERNGQERRGGDRGAAEISLTGLNQLWARAEQQTPGWRIISLRLPNSADAPMAFTIDQGDGGQPHKRGQLTLDRKSGDVVRWEPFSAYTTGRKLRTILRFAHTGEALGAVGQTIAGLVSLGACFLVWTGLALSWRRLRAWLAKRKAATVPSTAPLAEAPAESKI
jgi:uncharacterized iron-regulated membrane protein